MADTVPTKNETPTSVTIAKSVSTDDLAAKSTEADALIKRYALLGTATGFIPGTGLDTIASTAVSVKMIKDLGDIYGFSINEQILGTVITSGVTSVAGTLIGKVVNSLSGSFTPIKMFMGGATQAAISGFLTLEIGNIYKTKMELGEDPAEIGLADIASHMFAQVQEGKWDPNKLSLTNQLSSMLNSNQN